MPTRRGLISGGVSGLLAVGAFPRMLCAQETASPPVVEADDPRFAQFAAARREFWSQIGPVDEDVIGYLISPQFQGKPAWPSTRQAYLIARPEESLIIASDGLSDLFVDWNFTEPGFECEVYIETPDLVGASFDEIKQSWHFSLIENFAQNVANWGGINGALDDYGILSTELPAPEGMPQRWVTDRDTVGALMGMQVNSRAASFEIEEGSQVRMVPLTILLPDEVDYVIEYGRVARPELAQRLIAAGTGLISTEDRMSVLA